MTTTFPKRGSNPDNRFQPFCLEQPQKQSRSHIKTIGPFILITLIVGLIILLPQGKEDVSIVIPPSIKEWRCSGAKSLVQTTDGGFVLAGFTELFDAEGFDMLLMKTDTNGVAQWNQTYGSTGDDEVNDLVQTIDGGFALVGSTDQYGVTEAGFGSTGYTDMLLVKTDASGNVTWHQSYGSFEDDYGNAVIQTNDGEFVLGGETYCRGWLVKTDASGVMIWNQNYSDTDPDEVIDLVQTIDGGFALVGDTERSAHGVLESSEILLVKIDANGVIQWTQTYKFEDTKYTNNVKGNAVIQTVDGGFALVGSISSVGKGYGSYYMWLVKTDANGVMIWNQTYGGTHVAVDEVNDLVQTIDGGFVLVGDIVRGEFGFIPSFDIWLVKTDANGLMIWNQTYDSTENDEGNALVQTTDGGFALAGFTGRPGIDSDMWLMKTDANGVAQWNQTYNGADQRTKLIHKTSTTITTPTPGWGLISFLVAAVVLTTWTKRHKNL
jgi:hypothetical protein